MRLPGWFNEIVPDGRRFTRGIQDYERRLGMKHAFV